MKILYHHRTASKDGQAVHIEEMVASMRKLGHEVRVVAPAVGDEGRMGGEVSWVQRLRSILPNAVYELMELAYTWVAYRRLRAAAAEFKPDIIYERYNLYLLAGLMLKKKLGIPLLLEVNAPLVQERSAHSGGLSLKRLARWAEGTAWRGANYVLPVTQVLGEHVRAYGVPAERIAVIPNGINEEHFAAAPAPEQAKAERGLSGKLVLGFTGFVREWHGVDRVIRWMASLSAPANAHLLVVGDGPVRVALESLARELEISDRVTFTGVIHREQVPAWVASFDIALQPAVVAYASPLKLMEYLGMGKAVLAPRTPNLCEVLDDGDNAFLFDETQSDGLELALAQLCNDTALRQRLALGARASIVSRELTWDGNARRVLALADRSL
jgi:glycosyltransferase involved in cell wall biosynthesis